jgi:hypothetical protein
MKFRKKPVEIEAIQWFKLGDHPAVMRFRDDISESIGYIETLEGGHIVNRGDWIITGVKGEHYPVKSDIFQATYEPVEDLDGLGREAETSTRSNQALERAKP